MGSALEHSGPLQHVVRHNMLYDITAPQPSLPQVSSIDDVFLGHFHLRFLPSKHVTLTALNPNPYSLKHISEKSASPRSRALAHTACFRSHNAARTTQLLHVHGSPRAPHPIRRPTARAAPAHVALEASRSRGVPARLHGTARTGVFRETDPKATGHSQFWGIGRHILGSQVPLLIA